MYKLTNNALTSYGSISGPHEIRCVKRNFLLETLENELPEGTIRYSSKIVAIEEEGNVKLLHMADGSIIRANVRHSDTVHSCISTFLSAATEAYTTDSILCPEPLNVTTGSGRV
jgi:hypothetical protein